MINYFRKSTPPKWQHHVKPLTYLSISAALILGSCAQVTAPDTRNVNIPSPKFAKERQKAINEVPDAITYLPLGHDVLVPEASFSHPLPKKFVGPFELRGETLGGALQLITDGTDIPIAFESEDGLDSPITVTNLKGEMETVVSRVCSLADLYCSFENGILIVKDTQLFTVTIPPVGDADEFLTNVASAIEEIVGGTVITDNSTRTLVYRASQRNSEVAESYFQRIRANTALIIFETYIWEVSLNSGNSTGIDWESIDSFGKYEIGVNLAGAASPALGSPVSIGLPTTNGVAFDGNNVFQFISEYGAVKTISQPQVTVMSGSSARFRVADTQNFVSEITRSVDDGAVTVSTSTDSVDTGFTFDIGASWDSATVYGNIDILLQEVRSIDTFDDNPDAIVQLPQTTERELSTQVRIRPGDSLLIAGLVREIDNFSKEGPGIQEPIFPSSRTAQTSNVELVFLLRPRVIIYTTPTSRQFEDLRAESARQLQNSTQAFIDKVNMAKQLPSPVPSVQPITAVSPMKKAPPLEEYKPLPIIVNDRQKKPIGNPLPEIKVIEEDYVPVRPVFSH